jgi:dephospho-CoA kinase
VLLVGLTGGIGTGKSTVARLLRARGAVVVDADELARRALDPGTPGRDRVAEQWGDGVLLADGSVDREALASRVFDDAEARRTLESIVHPEVMRLIREEVARHRGTDDVVVLDVPLLFETGMDGVCDVTVVVAATEEEQVTRLTSDRGMAEEQVRARIAAQMPLERKEARADVVVRNDGSPDELAGRVETLWRELQARAGAGGS